MDRETSRWSFLTINRSCMPDCRVLLSSSLWIDIAIS